MSLDDMLTDVSVIGAAGKMGSGIATLLAQEVANQKIVNPDKIYRVNLIDVDEKGLDGLRKYIKSQMVKIAEKSIVELRGSYSHREDLVENGEVIDAYVEEALGAVRFGTDLRMVKNSKAVFEAIIENEEIKVKIYKELKEWCGKDTLFFTNTSSIPIGYLDNEVGLDGRLIGYHFYNPPIVQKLVEVITSDKTTPEAREIAADLGKRLRKKLIPANDVAGFIGNGHFMRDGLFGIAEVERLGSTHSFPRAVYIINRVTQDFLIRPMGIFQLIDYVGIDVFQSILRVMKRHLGEDSLHSDLVNAMIEKGVRGGQRSDGSQKDGFFQYKRNRPEGVYDLEKGKYVPLSDFSEEIDSEIGSPPDGYLPWKNLLGHPDRETVLSGYFGQLKSHEGMGAQLAHQYLLRSKEIGEELVKDGVADSADDVNAVLVNGFYWLYGPVNDYV